MVTVFQYAPVTSVDVKRYFSAYKNILTDFKRNKNYSNAHETKHNVNQVCN